MRLYLFLFLVATPCLSLAAVPDGWFPFVIPDIAEDSVANVSSYNNTVAGENGFIEVRDGRFVDGAGKRLKFLATNLTFGEAFPSKEIAPKIAARMAALGINCVRFHHMDAHFNPRGIWDPKYKDRRHIDPEMIDRLDWIIYQLKLHGIYADINLHVSRTFTEADGFENAGKLPKYDKGVDNFEPRMIQLQRDYARDLLTHENPYTKTRYVDEPCIAMVELNNENSMLRFSFGSTFHLLPEPYRGELMSQWTAHLRGRYADTQALRKAWDEGSEPLGDEMLRNQDFSQGAAEWVLESRHTEADVFEVADDPALGKVLHARLNELGVNSWDFQIHQKGHNLKDGRVYTVAFRIKADPPRTVNVSTRYDVPDWRMVGLNQSISVGKDWVPYTFTFTAKEPKPDHTRLSFNCQNSLGSVWIADVSFRPGGIRGLAEGQSLEEGTVDFPTAGATRQAWKDWIGFAMEAERKYTVGLRDYLKQELGLHAPVIDTQASYGGLGGIAREARMDFIDIHAYWQHPRFPGKPWDGNNWNIGNTPMTKALGNDTLSRLAMHRVAGMPFTVSEYNHPAPSDYRAECMPMLAALAALQDWDGVFQFCYGDQDVDWNEATIQSYFRMVTDPAKVTFFPIAANLFRRGDVRPADREVRLRVPTSQVLDLVAEHTNDVTGIWAKAGVPRKAAIRHRLALEWTESGELSADSVNLPPGPFVTSDTDEINWMNPEDAEETFWVETPKTRVVLGHIAGAGVVFKDGVDLDVGKTEDGWVAVALTSMDDRPILESGRMLLVVMSKCENQDMGWDEERKTVGRNWGTGPVIAEGIDVTVSFPGRTDLKAYSLKPDGTRDKLIAPTDETFVLGPEYHTVWYEFATQ